MVSLQPKAGEAFHARPKSVARAVTMIIAVVGQQRLSRRKEAFCHRDFRIRLSRSPGSLLFRRQAWHKIKDACDNSCLAPKLQLCRIGLRLKKRL